MTTSTTAGPQRSQPRTARGTGRPGVATRSGEAVLTALADHPGTTAEQLATATDLGRSTVTKTLAALAADQRVARSPGGRSQGRRLADRWSLPPAAPTAEEPAPTNGEPDDDLLPLGDKGKGRLGKGELHGLVAARLTAEPTSEFTPTRLAGLLGRSAGAIGNALARMVDEGLAVQTASAPRRYQHAPTTSQAQ
ncbi:MAG: hypothetical protein ACYCUG_08385 [Acidimicrobiales bacterium]